MRNLFVLILLIPFQLFSQQFSRKEIEDLKSKAGNVTIIRDIYGVPHVYGKTDADAVFGLLYAQCEENFPRIERNYLEMMGRLSEIDGKTKLLDDLEMRLIYDSSGAKKDFQSCEPWFKKLLIAFADGINYYLAIHPDVHPLILKRFEPWFPLMYTDGSIAPTQDGGITTSDINNLYGDNHNVSYSNKTISFFDNDPTGSNGFALAPSKTSSKNAILYINPHVTFYFRSEVHMVSGEGLNAYGAVTWGQFFVYQGFNQHCGWMHTSSYADVADLYMEKITRKGDSLFYSYDSRLLPVKLKEIAINYKSETGNQQQTFKTYFTHHGPVLGSRNGTWLSLRENNRSLTALMQSWLRTKADGFQSFKKVMNLRSNNSNNTVFADDKGNIAYWHGNFMPKRDPHINWEEPVDGSTSATEWRGVHALDEIVHVYNPSSGWIENCNSTPFTVSGKSSPKKENYPVYMAPDGQNSRAVNAIRLLSNAKDMTIDKLIKQVGYNHYLSAFDILLPSLFEAWQSLPDYPDRLNLKEPVDSLKGWNKYSSAGSIASSIAIEWAYKLAASIPPPKSQTDASNGIGQLQKMVNQTSAEQKLQLLKQTIDELT
ncbi:MAG TPA: penicillin acylase family protein, partial [Flavisolibacter sp.]|nr:penicillin acylase family protein [Flavisolibacter sp.]